MEYRRIQEVAQNADHVIRTPARSRRAGRSRSMAETLRTCAAGYLAGKKAFDRLGEFTGKSC